MEDIRDCKGRLACRGNATTGFIEIAYKRCKTSTQIPIGGRLKIERDDVVTIVSRPNNSTFYVESRIQAA